MSRETDIVLARMAKLVEDTGTAARVAAEAAKKALDERDAARAERDEVTRNFWTLVEVNEHLRRSLPTERAVEAWTRAEHERDMARGHCHAAGVRADNAERREAFSITRAEKAEAERDEARGWLRCFADRDTGFASLRARCADAERSRDGLLAACEDLTSLLELTADADRVGSDTWVALQQARDLATKARGECADAERERDEARVQRDDLRIAAEAVAEAFNRDVCATCSGSRYTDAVHEPGCPLDALRGEIAKARGGA